MATRPTVAAVATDEPEMAAKMPQAVIVATPSELEIEPAQALVTSNRSRPAPVRCMMVPVRMNKGSAINSKIEAPCQAVLMKPLKT